MRTRPRRLRLPACTGAEARRIVKPGGAVVLSRASVSAGRYRLTVEDHGKRDNFHLHGRTVNKRTGLAFRGRVGWGVTLARGAYSYGSDRTGLTRKLRVR